LPRDSYPRGAPHVRWGRRRMAGRSARTCAGDRASWLCWGIVEEPARARALFRSNKYLCGVVRDQELPFTIVVKIFEIVAVITVVVMVVRVRGHLRPRVAQLLPVLL
jgi:hypothetical protein